MAQLYIQKAVVPDSWDMSGAPATTVICLAVDATINYSDGSADTLPANTPAVLPDASTAFDRTHDVYVPYTVQGSGVLSIIKESLLPTLTDDYAPLARVELHGIKPYQPEPYLSAGGLGATPATTTTIVSTAAAERVYDLGNSSGYGAEPSGWQNVGFADSGWATSVAEVGGPVLLSGADWVSFTTASEAGSEIMLLRRSFILPAGVVQSASLDLGADAEILGVWVNGTVLYSGDMVLWPLFAPSPSSATLSVPPADLAPGGANVLALKVRNGSTDMVNHGEMGCQYLLTISSGATGGVPDPGGHEGDLLYYHSGAWTTLPIGTNGEVLKSDGTDPGWAAAAAGTVTSVALAGPTGTTVGGSPVTSSGTITLSWASQSANTVLASPNGSSGAPTFRALAAGDIPSLPASQITSGQLASARGGTGVDGSGATNGQLLIGNGTGYALATLTAGSNITITNGAGTITIASTAGGSGTVTSVTLTMPGIFSVAGSPITTSGTLAVSLATQSANTVFAGPASGSAAAPTFRTLQPADLPAAASAGGHIHAHGHFL